MLLPVFYITEEPALMYVESYINKVESAATSSLPAINDSCQENLTVEHILIHCAEYFHVGIQCFDVDNLQELFNTVSPDTILGFIQRARLFYILSSQKYTEYLLLVINIVFIPYIFNELYAHIIYDMWFYIYDLRYGFNWHIFMETVYLAVLLFLVNWF